MSSGNDIFNARASNLEGAVFNGGLGTDTLNLIGGGTFDLTAATLSSIEIVRGTSSADTIILNSQTLSGIQTLSGGSGSNLLTLSGSGTYNFAGKAVSGFTRIDATAKGFTGATFDNKATAMLLWAKQSQHDTLTLRGGAFTEEERAQLHRQGVDTIIDASGTYANSAPILKGLAEDRVYTSRGQTFLDRDLDSSIGDLDDKLSSLRVTFEDEWMLPGQIAIVENGRVTLPDGLTDGGSIQVEGIAIGTIALLGEGNIEIHFNAQATASSVEELLHALAYKNLDAADPSVREVYVTLTLTDEGGRSTNAYTDVFTGKADIQFLDHRADALTGTEDNDVFASDSISVTAGDAIDGGNGTDTLLLFQGGSFDLTQLSNLSGVEETKGSDHRDMITIHASQLADVRTIDGGETGMGGIGDNSNFLNLAGTDIDLRGKTILNFSAIILRTDHAVVTVADKAMAKMISGTLVAHAQIELTGGESFTAAERGLLFRHGIESITDASGIYVNEAPELDRLDGDHAFGIAGHSIFIDADRNALLTEDDQAFSSLTVSVKDGTATERLGLASTGKVQVIEMAGGNLCVYVNGINIGFIALPPVGGPELTIQFNEKSAPSLVQEVIRALTYTDTSGTVATPREIKLTLKDYTNHSTEVSVTVEQELNEKPTDMALDGSLVSELSSIGTVVGVLGATDENVDDTFSYTLLNNAGGRFALNGNVLVVKQGVKLDYEQASSHEITVRVTDKLGLTFDKTFTIDVVDVKGEIAVGTASRDIFVGDERNDRFYGKLGNDRLTGGTGQDIFVFDTKLGSTNIDTIRDFSVKDDTIWLSRSIFTKAGRIGALSKDAFWVGATAHDASDRIIYNKETGALSYDADGNGTGRAIKFAQLSAGLKMTAADFVMI